MNIFENAGKFSVPFAVGPVPTCFHSTFCHYRLPFCTVVEVTWPGSCHLHLLVPAAWALGKVSRVFHVIIAGTGSYSSHCNLWCGLWPETMLIYPSFDGHLPILVPLFPLVCLCVSVHLYVDMCACVYTCECSCKCMHVPAHGGPGWHLESSSISFIPYSLRQGLWIKSRVRWHDCSHQAACSSDLIPSF